MKIAKKVLSQLRFPEYWEENTPSLETFLRYRRRTCPDEQLKKDVEHLNYAKDLETICKNYSYKKYTKAFDDYKDETKSDSVEVFWDEQTKLQRIRILELQGAGDMLKLGNDHLTKSAVVSQELQLGILSNRVTATSKKEESELGGEPSSSTHLERKRPAEEYSPATLPPNLRDRTPAQHPRVQIHSDDDFFENEDEEDDEEKEEVNESEDISTEVQLFLSRMNNVKNCRLFKYSIVNLSEKNLVDPVNVVFTKENKKRMRKFWEEMEPSAEEKQNTVRREKWETIIKPLVNKYALALEVKAESVFDDNVRSSSMKVIFESPFEGEFDFIKHYENLWVQDIYRRFICMFYSSFNILRDANTLEIAYREAFVNPLIPRSFDDLNDKIRFQIGEIESKLRKKQRNEIKGQSPRVNFGTKHDGILKIYMNAIEMEIGFLEVVGNAIAEDLTGYHGDMEKLFKAMQISIFYQRQHHLLFDN